MPGNPYKPMTPPPRSNDYPLLHATRADLLRALGRNQEVERQPRSAGTAGGKAELDATEFVSAYRS